MFFIASNTLTFFSEILRKLYGVLPLSWLSCFRLNRRYVTCWIAKRCLIEMPLYRTIILKTARMAQNQRVLYIMVGVTWELSCLNAALFFARPFDKYTTYDYLLCRRLLKLLPLGCLFIIWCLSYYYQNFPISCWRLCNFVKTFRLTLLVLKLSYHYVNLRFFIATERRYITWLWHDSVIFFLTRYLTAFSSRHSIPCLFVPCAALVSHLFSYTLKIDRSVTIMSSLKRKSTSKSAVLAKRGKFSDEDADILDNIFTVKHLDDLVSQWV